MRSKTNGCGTAPGNIVNSFTYYQYQHWFTWIPNSISGSDLALYKFRKGVSVSVSIWWKCVCVTITLTVSVLVWHIGQTLKCTLFKKLLGFRQGWARLSQTLWPWHFLLKLDKKLALHFARIMFLGRRKNTKTSGHLHLCQQPRAAHALRSDQYSVNTQLIPRVPHRLR